MLPQGAGRGNAIRCRKPCPVIRNKSVYKRLWRFMALAGGTTIDGEQVASLLGAATFLPRKVGAMADQNQATIPAIEPNTLYIGLGVCVKGEVTVPGIVVVDGVVEGNVNARAVWVSESGSIKGTIVATESEIHGTVSESVQVKQLLSVHSTGRVLGDIRYGELQLEKGAVLSGTLSCVTDEQAPVVESVLGKVERPRVVHRAEGNRPLNGAVMNGMLPPPDFRAAS
jgi:cytoskeletal protein CcmA (bactofilin family)